MIRARWVWVGALALGALACDDEAAGVEPTDGGRAADGAVGDAQPPDAAPDAGQPQDAQPQDAGRLDAQPLDAQPLDAGPDDAQVDQAVDAALPADARPEDAAPDMAAPACRQTVAVAGFEVFAFEASHADATADGHGADPEVCSRPGVLPWVSVTQAQAQAACQAVGFALCTGAAWERICAGEPGSQDYRAFPYGNAHAGGLCNDHVSGGGALEPTGARPGCVTPEGVFDLSGNVWERVADPDGRRGASWRPDAVNFRVDAARCDRQVFVGGDFAVDDLGFRCCRPLD